MSYATRKPVHFSFIALWRHASMYRIFFFFAFVFVMTFGTDAEARSRPLKCYSAKETRERIARHRLANPLILMRRFSRRYRAQPLRSRLCRQRNVLVYQFLLLRRDGRVIRAYAPARRSKSSTRKSKSRSGKIIKTKPKKIIKGSKNDIMIHRK